MSIFKPEFSIQEYKANVRKVKDFEDDIKGMKARKGAEDDVLKGYGKFMDYGVDYRYLFMLALLE